MKTIYICRDLSLADDGGRVVTRRNLMLLKKISQSVYIIETPSVSILYRILNFFLLLPYNHSNTVCRKLNIALKKGYNTVFLDSSLYGKYAKRLSKKGLKVYCFYHNIEFEYFRQRAYYNKSLLDIIYLYYIWYNEYLTTKYADIHITINERDNNELGKIYGYKTDLVLPTTLDSVKVSSRDYNGVPYCLFVGSDFFANREGVSWFIKNVLLHINIKLVIVGNICTFLEKEQLGTDKVEFRGFVEDLDEVYINASCVISPIFSGSGLKTKTIEALKYGKIIFGTNEAFMGLESHISKIGVLCNTKEEFIKSMTSFALNNSMRFNATAYEVFMKNYSHDTAYLKLKEIMKDGKK